MSRLAKLLLVFGLMLGALATVNVSSAQAGDLCFGHGCYDYAPAYVAPVCYYKVFYYDHCHGLECYGTFSSLHVAKIKARHLDLLGYDTIIKTVH